MRKSEAFVQRGIKVVSSALVLSKMAARGSVGVTTNNELGVNPVEAEFVLPFAG
jgi:hypothetical protein